MALSFEDQLLISELIHHETASLRAELDRVDGFATGLLGALQEVLIPLLQAHPDLAEKIEPVWRRAAERYDRDAAGQTEQLDEPLEMFEARRMLYRQLAALGVWPGVDAAAFRQAILEQAGWRDPGL